jgi:GTP-binding protein Era
MSPSTGFVAVVGRTNVGKSTLINGVVGEKVGIVTPKPQTTRNVIRGIYTEERGQIIFLDTPGIHKPRTQMNRNMIRRALETLEGVDAILWMLEAPKAWGREEDLLAEHVMRQETSVLLVINKVDLLSDKRNLLPLLGDLGNRFPEATLYPMSALHPVDRTGLVDLLFPMLPEAEPVFPADIYTDQLERQLAAEVVREKIFLLLHQEVPHCTGVLVEAFEEPDRENGVVRISCAILVERESQKPILIGKGGQSLKAIGTRARLELDRILGCRVYLELFVKVKPRWRENISILREMGLA